MSAYTVNNTILKIKYTVSSTVFETCLKSLIDVLSPKNVQYYISIYKKKRQ